MRWTICWQWVRMSEPNGRQWRWQRVKMWHRHRHYKSHVIDGDFIRISLIKYTELQMPSFYHRYHQWGYLFMLILMADERVIGRDKNGTKIVHQHQHSRSFGDDSKRTHFSSFSKHIASTNARTHAHTIESEGKQSNSSEWFEFVLLRCHLFRLFLWCIKICKQFCG